MTRLSPVEKCVVCGGLLVPPELASAFTISKEADFVCLRCGRPYRWRGEPPQLTLLVAVERGDDEDETEG